MSEQPIKISTGGVKKGRNEGLKAVTANRLIDGLAVYFTQAGKWTFNIVDAATFEGDAALEALALTTKQEVLVVGPYLMDVGLENGAIVLTGRGTLREQIRNIGPTVQSDFSLQGGA